ncbi:MAG: c-type cytochrome [Verrucomicrobiales bacterium]|nr:c-type cytochrome [Verrucomicrobiales bacterium]
MKSMSRLPFRPAALLAIIPCLIGDHTLFAQRGDRDGHEMKPPPAHWKIPDAPVVSADKALATFAVPEGFRVELVAAEPMNHDPVALAFDANGRIWVVEMRGYMPDIDGHGEDQPTGRISVLVDDDGDGKADRNAVFLDGLVMPRAVALTAGDRAMLFADGESLYEVAIVEGPDGLPKAGEKSVVDADYAKGGNPEHKPNGLRHALDNWIYSSKCDRRYRRVGGKWVEEKTEFRGQWGIDQDDFGRLFTNTNSNCVSAEEVAAGVTVANPNHEFRSPVTAKMKNQRMWPARITPGINRGYLEGFLNDQGFLIQPTAVSGLAVYRGDQFPAEFRGNLFINEPGGNLVKRAIIAEKDGRLTIDQAYDGREFFTSTDERSRIVNSYTAPDGTLYLVDFYRGILQHAAYMTSYLRQQVQERGLDKPVGLGRIWRVVHEGREPGPTPRLREASVAELVGHLSHPNGWWRDTAQRLLVERADGAEAVGALKKLVADSAASPLGRMHAVWTLEGLGALSPVDVAAAFDPAQPALAAQAIHAAESLALGDKAGEVVSVVSGYLEAGKPLPVVLRRQVLASLGRFSASETESVRDAAFAALRLALATPADAKEAPLGRDLALSGLAGRELAFLKSVADTDAGREISGLLIAAVVKSNDPAARQELLTLVSKASGGAQVRLMGELARVAVAQRQMALIDSLFSLAASDAKLADSLADGLLAGRKALGQKFKPLPLSAKPAVLATADGLPDEKKRDQVAAMFDFSGKAADSFLKTDEHRRLFELGKQQYAVICGACHQPHGKGQEFISPPLVDSEWVTGPANRLIALALDGAMGPITVAGKTYTVPEIQPVMPGLRLNPEITDEKMAAMLTYIRNEWGNAAPPITPDMVKAWRDKTEVRAPYTEAELKKIK